MQAFRRMAAAAPRPFETGFRKQRALRHCAKLLVWWCAAAAPCVQAQVTLADQNRLAWVRQLSTTVPAPNGAPGRWFPWDNQFGRVRGTFERGGISKTDGEAWDRHLRAIVDFLKTAPVLATNPPPGFYPEMSGHIGVLDQGGFDLRPKQAPLVGGVTLYAWPPTDVRADAQGAPRLAPGAHNVSFRLELNYVYPPRGDAWMSDAQGEFGALEKQGEFAGFPLYGNSLVVTRDGRLPFVPVTQERALKAFIVWQEKQSAGRDEDLAAQRRRSYEDYVSPEGRARRQAAIEAEARGVHPTMSEQARRRAEAIDKRREQDLLAEANKGPSPAVLATTDAKRRLAAMGAAERGAPAWFLPGRGQGLELVPQGTPGAMSLVAFDPSFFDPKQPRTTLRVASVRELHNVVDCAQTGRAACAIYLQLLQQTDWRAFAERFLR
ncbi:MAG TPA: hypothetical protein PKV98_07690 [Burkholderiaceae bacterium]|nr:hypothetical protein [Burkholderiaceae bacterium]